VTFQCCELRNGERDDAGRDVQVFETGDLLSSRGGVPMNGAHASSLRASGRTWVVSD
jgi:hypothetical protein